MLTLDRATPITVTEARAIQAALGFPVAIAGYLGGPCAAEAWSADTFVQLHAAGFPMVGVWVGSNDACWVQDYSTATAIAHAERAWQDAQRAGMSEAPCILDVEYGTFAHHAAEVTAYALAWVARYRELGGKPWVYGNAGICDATVAHADGIWLAAWRGNNAMPLPADVPPRRAHQYANDCRIPGATNGVCDASIFNDADLHRAPLDKEDTMRVSRHFTFNNVQHQTSITDNGSRFRIAQLDGGGNWADNNDLNCPDGNSVQGKGIANGERVMLDPNSDVDIDLRTDGECHISALASDGRTFKAFGATSLGHWIVELIG